MNNSPCRLRQSLLALMLAVATHNSIAAGQSKNIETNEKSFTLELGSSRVIYSPDSSGATLTIMNHQDFPILVKSEAFNEDKFTPAPFIVTPPVFRLDSQQQSRVRIVRTGGDFAKNRETLQWLCVTGIPPKEDDNWAEKDGKAFKPTHASLNLLVSVKSCIKLLVRPSSVRGEPTDMASALAWQRQGDKLNVTNPTPFYMNLSSLTVGGKSVKGVDYIPPQAHREFFLPKGASGDIEWKVITDYGGDSRAYTSDLK